MSTRKQITLEEAIKKIDELERRFNVVSTEVYGFVGVFKEIRQRIPDDLRAQVDELVERVEALENAA